jgi:hypothetical protein
MATLLPLIFMVCVDCVLLDRQQVGRRRSPGHPCAGAATYSGCILVTFTLLLAAEQRLLYLPGRTVSHASGSYRGDGKIAMLKTPRSYHPNPRCDASRQARQTGGLVR